MSVKLFVHLVTWNSSKYLPYLLESLRAQTCREWELLIVDNYSSDGTIAAISRGLENFPVPARVIENKENIGFTRGHNQALKDSAAPLVAIINPDMYLAPDCFQKLMNFLDTHPEAAAVAPRLMRWNFNAIAENGLDQSLTSFVDALGLKVFRSRRAIEQHTGADWERLRLSWPESVQAIPVFGVSGAFAVFRRSALAKILYADGTLFDESYFMYKEDVDVAYRLAETNNKSFVVLNAICHHDRTGAGPRELSDEAAMFNKKNHNFTVRYYSYKNHLLTLYKNEYWQNFLLDFPLILWYELKKFIYFLLFDRKVLSGLAELWRQRIDARHKRQQIKKARTANWRAIRIYWD